MIRKFDVDRDPVMKLVKVKQRLTFRAHLHCKELEVEVQFSERKLYFNFQFFCSSHVVFQRKIASSCGVFVPALH